MLAPVFFAQAHLEAGGAAVAKSTDHAVAGLEAMLHVQRLPRTALFVLGVGHAVVSVVVALRAHVGFAGHRATLKILRELTEGSADVGIGMIVRAHGADAAVYGDLVADRAADHGHGRAGGRRARARGAARGRQRWAD